MHEQAKTISGAQQTAAAAGKVTEALSEGYAESSSLSIQCKLTVGAIDDPLEREADAIAAQVMRMPEQGMIQRKCSSCNEEDRIQRQSLLPFIQRKTNNHTGTNASRSDSDRIQSARGTGKPMSAAAKTFMESRFGADFSQVKIHSDSEAIQLSSNLNARAFTIGSDIFFNNGQYNPDSEDGKQLLAHELTHVIQQAGPGENLIQRAVLNINDFDMTNSINALTAVSDPDYIDNGIIDWALRSDGSIMSPTFTAFTLFYEDGTIFDIPAAANSAFPNFSNPSGTTITVHLRHTPSGKIFPITYLMSDFLAASDPTDIRTIPNPQFLFLRRAGGTPNIISAFDMELVRIAFAYAGLVGQIWNVALGVRGAIQIFQLSGALRAAATARTGVSGATALAQGGTTAAGAGASSMSRIITITVNVLKRAAGLTSAEMNAIQQVEGRLNTILQRAINEVNAGTATGAWAQRLASTPATSGTYRMVLGNAIHEHSFTLIQQDIASGLLPAGIRTNIGRAAGGGLTNSFGRLRPDIRMPLSGGREAIFDITTTGQAGHASRYSNFSFVDYISELLY